MATPKVEVHHDGNYYVATVIDAAGTEWQVNPQGYGGHCPYGFRDGYCGWTEEMAGRAPQSEQGTWDGPTHKWGKSHYDVLRLILGADAERFV